MPYDEPDPVVDCDLLARKIEVLEAKAHVDVALYGTVAKQVDVAMIGRLADAGVAAFKISTYESHPKRFPRISHPEMERAFRAIAETGLNWPSITRIRNWWTMPSPGRRPRDGCARCP